MPDIMSAEKRSQLMSRIRGRDTTPERYLAAMLEAAGASFTSHDRDLPGRPDIIFRQSKVAVFIDGDFWHGWRFPVWQRRLSKPWQDKIAANRERDRRNHRTLRARGWIVVRIWEHEVERDVWECFERIIETIKQSKLCRRAAKQQLASMPVLKYRSRLPRPNRKKAQ